MKPILLVLLTYLMNFLSAQQTVKLSGTILNPNADKVYLRYYSDYLFNHQEVVDSAVLDANGNFNMEFDWNNPRPALFYNAGQPAELFLTPGDSLFFTANAGKIYNTIRHTGKGSPINNYLAEENLIDKNPTFRTYKLAEKEFIAWVDTTYDRAIRRLYKNLSLNNKQDERIEYFGQYQKLELNYARANRKVEYPVLHAALTGKDASQVSPGYYDFLNTLSIDDSLTHAAPEYLQFVENYVDYQSYKLYKQDTTQLPRFYKKNYIETNTSGEIKDFLIAAWANDVIINQGDYERGMELIKWLETTSPGSKYLKDINIVVSQLVLAPGTQAPDFTLPDIKGHAVSLSDFRGKIVYLDFWSTSCGPCREEIPAAKELEKSLHEKDIVFLAVSLDKSQKAWKNLIKKEGLPGIHLRTDGIFDSPIAQEYRVIGIPHYYLIDENGIIIDNNAPRPSGGAKEAIQKELIK